MATVFRRSDSKLGSVGTSRYIMIATSPATVYNLGSGSHAFTVFNIGSGSLIWGDSNIAVNSGSYLFVTAGRTFENLQDRFQIFFRAESVQTLISISEFGV